MHDATMRLAALVIAALLAMSAAALTTTLVAGDAQALTGNTGNAQTLG